MLMNLGFASFLKLFSVDGYLVMRACGAMISGSLLDQSVGWFLHVRVSRSLVFQECILCTDILDLKKFSKGH